MKGDSIYFPQMATIKEAADLSGIAVYRIRQLCKQNKIRYVPCGKRFLVNLESLAAYMEKGEPTSQNEPLPGIRRQWG